MAHVVESVVDMSVVVGTLVVVGDCRLAGFGLVLENVASEDPQNTRYSAFRVAGSLWDVLS